MIGHSLFGKWQGKDQVEVEVHEFVERYAPDTWRHHGAPAKLVQYEDRVYLAKWVGPHSEYTNSNWLLQEAKVHRLPETWEGRKES